MALPECTDVYCFKTTGPSNVSQETVKAQSSPNIHREFLLDLQGSWGRESIFTGDIYIYFIHIYIYKNLNNWDFSKLKVSILCTIAVQSEYEKVFK